MVREWQELTRLTKGEPIVVERVRLADKDIAIEGAFELPALAQLSFEDQVFVAAFVRAHGSIKEMEKLFGVSYPSIKNRLNRIGQKFQFIDVNPEPSAAEVLEKIKRGEMTVQDALKEIEK